MCKDERNDLLISLQQLMSKISLNSLPESEYDLLADNVEEFVDLISSLNDVTGNFTLPT